MNLFRRRRKPAKDNTKNQSSTNDNQKQAGSDNYQSRNTRELSQQPQSNYRQPLLQQKTKKDIADDISTLQDYQRLLLLLMAMDDVDNAFSNPDHTEIAQGIFSRTLEKELKKLRNDNPQASRVFKRKRDNGLNVKQQISYLKNEIQNLVQHYPELIEVCLRTQTLLSKDNRNVNGNEFRQEFPLLHMMLKTNQENHPDSHLKWHAMANNLQAQFSEFNNNCIPVEPEAEQKFNRLQQMLSVLMTLENCRNDPDANSEFGGYLQNDIRKYWNQEFNTFKEEYPDLAEEFEKRFGKGERIHENNSGYQKTIDFFKNNIELMLSEQPALVQQCELNLQGFQGYNEQVFSDHFHLLDSLKQEGQQTDPERQLCHRIAKQGILDCTDFNLACRQSVYQQPAANDMEVEVDGKQNIFRGGFG